MKPQSPCKDCEGRRVGCHAVCDKYADYCAVLDEWNRAVTAEKTKAKEATSFRQESYLRIHRKKGEQP